MSLLFEERHVIVWFLFLLRFPTLKLPDCYCLCLQKQLTDVEAGGATVFPRAGVTCWPRRGSAAFWWNLYKSGEADTTTRHGACPVLHGSKWGTLLLSFFFKIRRTLSWMLPVPHFY